MASGFLIIHSFQFLYLISSCKFKEYFRTKKYSKGSIFIAKNEILS